MSTFKLVSILIFSALYVQTNAGRPNCRGPNGEDLCQNGGICTKNLFSGAPNVCICPQRFDDEMYCKNRVKLCLHGGTFNETIQECDCVEPGYGIYCEYDRTKCKCQNGGECYASYIGLDLCRCPEGFGGEKCQFRLHTPDECSLLTSYNPETHQCDCLPGYRKLDDDVCVDVDECEETSPCQSGSSCSNVIGSYTCLNCPPHMTGRNCDVSRELDGDVTCRDGDDVSNSTVCLNGGRCSTEGANMCECKPGFSGKRCEDEWSLCEINNKCSDNSTCVQTLDSYLCNCDDGFSGARCHLMTSCDNVTSCANGGECSVYTGGDDVSGDVTMYKCECRRGYEGHRCQFQQEEEEVVAGWASMARITAIVLACVVITLVIGTIVAYVTVRRRTRQRYEVEERRRRHNDVIQSNEVSVTPTSSHLSSSSAGDMLHFATDKV